MTVYSSVCSNQSHEVQDGQSYTVWFTLLDEDDVAVASSRLDSATLTLLDQKSQRVINGRQNQSVLNANQVTIDPANGLVTWASLPADNALQRQTAREWHIATFTFVWDSGTKSYAHQVFLHVNALEGV